MFLRGVLLGQRISSIATAAKNSRRNPLLFPGQGIRDEMIWVKPDVRRCRCEGQSLWRQIAPNNCNATLQLCSWRLVKTPKLTHLLRGLVRELPEFIRARAARGCALQLPNLRPNFGLLLGTQ